MFSSLSKYTLVNIIYLLLLTVLVNVLFVPNVHSQTSCEIGTEGTAFWVGFMKRGNQDGKQIRLIFSSESAAQVSIYQGNNLIPFTVISMSAGISELTLPHNMFVVEDAHIPEYKGLLVQSDVPVRVFALNSATASSEAALILPLHALGQSYMTLGYTPTVQANLDIRFSEFLIVATEDVTEVTITPSVQTSAGNLAGVNFSLTLQKGQTYMVTSATANAGSELQSDLSGSKINSNKPIAVFSGNMHTRIPYNGGYCCQDHLYEQVYPLNTLGTHFLAIPFLSRNGDAFRAMATQNSTKIFKDGSFIGVLNEGEFYDFNSLSTPGQAFEFESDKPIMLAQFQVSQEADGISLSDVGDPSMLYLHPTEQSIEEVHFASFSVGNIQSHFVNIITPSSNISQIRFDGNPVTGFLPLGSTSYAYARLGYIGAGYHHIESLGAEGFLAYAYGTGNIESYAYSVGAGVSPILDFPDQLELCAGESYTFYPGPFEEYSWNGGAFGSQESIEITSAGTYTVAVRTPQGCVLTHSLQVAILPEILTNIPDSVNVCANSYFLDVTSNASQFKWKTINGNLLFDSNEPDFLFSSSGTYVLTSSTECFERKDTISIQLNPPPFLEVVSDTSICADKALIYASSNDPSSIEWYEENSDTPFFIGESFEFFASGHFILRYENDCGFVEKPLHIAFDSLSVHLPDSMIICKGDTALIEYSGFGATHFFWSNESSEGSNATYMSQEGWVILSATNDCSTAIVKDSCYVLVEEKPLLGMDSTIFGCESMSIQYIPLDTLADSYTWSRNGVFWSTAYILNTNISGSYRLIAKGGCGSDTLLVQVQFIPPPLLPEKRIIEKCREDPYIFSVTLDAGAHFSWWDGSEEIPREFNAEGSYPYVISHPCGTYTDTLFIKNKAITTLSIGGDQVLCSSQSLVLQANAEYENYQWNTGSTSNSILVEESGMYILEVFDGCGIQRDTARISIKQDPFLDLGQDLTSCEGVWVELKAGEGFNSYLWQDGSDLPFYIAKTSGLYWVEIRSDCGILRDSIQILLGVPPLLDLGKDTLICSGTYLLKAGTSDENADYLWQDGSSEPELNTSQSGLYWVEKSTACGVVRDSVWVTHAPGAQMLDLGADRLLCDKDHLDLVPRGFDSYVWQDGSTLSVYRATQTAWYWVEAMSECGSFRDSIYLEFSTKPLLVLPNRWVQCVGTLFSFEREEGVEYVWSDGVTAFERDFSTEGFYELIASNACGETRAQIEILLFDSSKEIPNVITPNGDGKNDVWKLPSLPLGAEVQVFNRWGQEVFFSKEYSNDFDGSGLPSGWYYYHIKIPCSENSMKGGIQIFKE